MEQMAMTIKIEVEVAATAHVDSEIDLNSGLLQSVKRELSFTNDVLVKEEILEDDTQDERDQQSVHDEPTLAATGGVNKACSTSLGDLLNVKYESTEMNIGPTLLQDMTTYYTINKNMSAATEGNAILDDCNEATPGDRVKKERVEEMWRGNKIKCNYCCQTITDYNEAHLNSCPAQGQLTTLQQHLLRQQQATSTNSFRCDVCGKTFRKPHLLSAHRKLHERDGTTPGATNSSVAGPSNVHPNKAAKAEPKPFKCNVCDKGYSSEANLSAHKRFHSDIGLSVCRICSAKFNKKSNLTIHLRTHTGEKPYQCDTCNARFADSRNLTAHKRVHTGEKPYQCDTCNARFTSSSHLTTHKRVHTGEKPYQCDTCNAKFTSSSDLTTHKRVHTGEKPYQCDTCNARFTTSSHLTKHKRVHTGEKLYQCDTCKARFTTNGALTRHNRVHTGEKPYQCDTCNARFTNNSTLTTHKRVHTGEKPYQCDTCNARFAQASQLTTHKRVHSGEKPFECTECGDKFTLKSHLNRHVTRRHHK